MKWLLIQDLFLLHFVAAYLSLLYHFITYPSCHYLFFVQCNSPILIIYEFVYIKNVHWHVLALFYPVCMLYSCNLFFCFNFHYRFHFIWTSCCCGELSFVGGCILEIHCWHLASLQSTEETRPSFIIELLKSLTVLINIQ